jgi:poly-beta-1,6-N-acetyl-D-glucosamine synthase
MTPAYVIITPARNEALHLQKTIEAVVAQTLRPKKWIIVNDGSSDATGFLAREAAKRHAWIEVVHRPDRGFRQPGGGVVEAFYDGYRALNDPGWDYLSKLDGDLSFPPDYFANSFSQFEADDRLGIGGGRVYSLVNGSMVEDAPDDPLFHVRGATKIYRRAVWEVIGGLLCAPGWDTLDELKANMHGWRTYSFKDLHVLQLKRTGSADGPWKNWFKNGRANYIVGYHPLFMFSKCLKRLVKPPVLIGAAALWLGYLSGYWMRVPQVADEKLIRYLRRQQINRLLFRPSLWSGARVNPSSPCPTSF